MAPLSPLRVLAGHECEPVSVDARTRLRPWGIKFAGKGFARARDRAAFWPRDSSFPTAETGTAAPACANVAENRGFFQRPQETRFARNWVVEDSNQHSNDYGR